MTETRDELIITTSDNRIVIYGSDDIDNPLRQLKLDESITCAQSFADGMLYIATAAGQIKLYDL